MTTAQRLARDRQTSHEALLMVRWAQTCYYSDPAEAKRMLREALNGFAGIRDPECPTQEDWEMWHSVPFQLMAAIHACGTIFERGGMWALENAKGLLEQFAWCDDDELCDKCSATAVIEQIESAVSALAVESNGKGVKPQ